VNKNYSNPSTVIFSPGQRKNEKISPKLKILSIGTSTLHIRAANILQ